MSDRSPPLAAAACPPARLASGGEPPPLAALARLPWYPWLIVATTCIGGFIGQLDASIVQLALPALERAFNASLSAVSWVAIAYLLAFAACLPAWGRLSEMFGRKLLYIAGYAAFTAASALCGMVSDLRLLVACRVVQGIGGALLGANSIAILVRGVSAERRGPALGILAAAQAVGVSAGPAVGGLLLASLGWRWVFWVSVPFGLAGVVVGWLVLPQTRDVDRDKRFDLPGALLLAPALIAIVAALSQLHAWPPPPLLALAAAAAVLLALFVRRERRAPAPLLDLQVFRVATFSGGIVAVSLSYALLYAMFFLMSFAFVRGYQESPIAAGLHLAIVPVAIGLLAPVSGALYGRLGARVLTSAGMAVCLAALLLLSLALGGILAPGLFRMAALALFGVGLGLFIAPNNSATMAAAPDGRSGEAGGMLNLMRVLGAALGVATASTALSWRLAAHGGIAGRTLSVPTATLLMAVDEVLPILAVFALAAAAIALLRGRSAPAR